MPFGLPAGRSSHPSLASSLPERAEMPHQLAYIQRLLDGDAQGFAQQLDDSSRRRIREDKEWLQPQAPLATAVETQALPKSVPKSEAPMLNPTKKNNGVVELAKRLQA